jgi:hypothetical protein
MPQAMEWEPFRPGPTDDGRFVADGNRLKAWDSGTGGNAPRRLSGQALEKGAEQRGKPEGLLRFRWRERNESQPYRLAVYLLCPILGAMPQAMEWEPFRPGPTDDGRCVADGNRLEAWDSGAGDTVCCLLLKTNKAASFGLPCSLSQINCNYRFTVIPNASSNCGLFSSAKRATA